MFITLQIPKDIALQIMDSLFEYHYNECTGNESEDRCYTKLDKENIENGTRLCLTLGTGNKWCAMISDNLANGYLEYKGSRYGFIAQTPIGGYKIDIDKIWVGSTLYHASAIAADTKVAKEVIKGIKEYKAFMEIGKPGFSRAKALITRYETSTPPRWYVTPVERIVRFEAYLGQTYVLCKAAAPLSGGDPDYPWKFRLLECSMTIYV